MDRNIVPQDDNSIQNGNSSQSIRKKQFYLSQEKMNLIASVLFVIEFAYSLEISFITPFFIKIETPDLLDSMVWLLPVLILLIANPTLKYFANNFTKQRMLILIMTFTSIQGMLMLCYAENFGEWYHRNDSNYNIHQIRKTTMFFGLFGFILMDVAHEILYETMQSFLETYTIDESKQNSQKIALSWIHSGKIVGFALASLPALGINIGLQLFQDNMAFCYFVGIILSIFVFLFIIPQIKLTSTHTFTWSEQAIQLKMNKSIDQIESEQQRKEINIKIDQEAVDQKSQQDFKEYKGALEKYDKVTMFFPEIEKIKFFPLEVKILLVSYFFCVSSYIMIEVYATSWVGISILNGVPEDSKTSLRRRIFEIGVSWGAFALLGTAMLSTIIQMSMHWLKKKFTEAQLLGISHIISAFALLSTLRVDEFSSVFIILPLCGFSFATVNLLPEEIAEQLELKLITQCKHDYVCHQAKNCPGKAEQKNLMLERSDQLHIPYALYKEGVFLRACQLSLLLSQIFMWSIVPSFFLIFQEIDDNIWGLASAGICSAIGAFFCFLL